MLWEDMEFLYKTLRGLERRIADLEDKRVEDRLANNKTKETHWRDVDQNEIIQKGFECEFCDKWVTSNSIGCTVKSQALILHGLQYRAPSNMKPIYPKENQWREVQEGEIIQEGFEYSDIKEDNWSPSVVVGLKPYHACRGKLKYPEVALKYRAPKDMKPVYPNNKYYYQGRLISHMTIEELQDALIAVCGVTRYDK